MNSISRYLLSAALAVASLGLGRLALADDNPGPPPPPHEHGGRGGQGRWTADQQLKMMTERLGLTADQQGQLLPILQQRDEKMKTASTDTNLPEDQRRAESRKIMTDTRALIGTILTPEQKAKWEQMGPGRNHHGEGHGHPEGPGTEPAGTSDPNKT